MAINPHVFAFLMLLAVPGMFIFAYALIAAVGDVSDAEPRPVPKWVAVKQVGDIAAPILEDSPLYRQSVVAGEPEVFIRSEELRFGNGAVFAKFLEKLPQIIAILTALKPLVS